MTFQCPKCPKTWKTPPKLRRHLSIHFKPEKDANSIFECPDHDCGQTFSSKDHLRIHKILHSDQVLVCKIDNKKFATKQALLAHDIVHTGHKPFQCAICDKKFNLSDNLRIHAKKKHNYSVKINRRGKCEYCGQNQSSFNGPHHHILTELKCIIVHLEPDKNIPIVFKCQEQDCGEMLSWTNDLKSHKQLHRNQALLCTIDSKKFKTKQALLKHKNVHIGEKTHNCAECGEKFSHSGYLKMHKTLHTDQALVGETPFQCAVCGKSFAFPGNLRTHAKKEHNYSVENNQHNKCDYCGRAQSSFFRLQNHMLEEHIYREKEEGEL